MRQLLKLSELASFIWRQFAGLMVGVCGVDLIGNTQSYSSFEHLVRRFFASLSVWVRWFCENRAFVRL